ncbi:hypothetical protein RRF57_005265 [Xylaria bambusicola]|uniref:Uncharacterized protein n=1 Tax=Xylaria bambusicola TaxID=326684 RepID=A0AAN7UC20_9PEZI
MKEVVNSELKVYVVGIVSDEVLECMIELGCEPEPLGDEVPVFEEDGDEDKIVEETGELDAKFEVVTEFVVLASVTGQSVVDTETSSVVTCPTGQFFTVGGQDVTV